MTFVDLGKDSTLSNTVTTKLNLQESNASLTASTTEDSSDDEDEVVLKGPIALIESIVETPDGTEIITYSNGTVTITSPNGNSVQINPSAINIQVQKTIINETDKTSKTFVADPISYTANTFGPTDDRIIPLDQSNTGNAECSATQQICGIENEDNENTNINENVAGSAGQP